MAFENLVTAPVGHSLRFAFAQGVVDDKNEILALLITILVRPVGLIRFDEHYCSSTSSLRIDGGSASKSMLPDPAAVFRSVVGCRLTSHWQVLPSGLASCVAVLLQHALLQLAAPLLWRRLAVRLAYSFIQNTLLVCSRIRRSQSLLFGARSGVHGRG